MNTVATINKIMNGYVLTNVETGEEYFLKSFSINKVLEAEDTPDHEKAVKYIVYDTPRDCKIQAIKAVRDYCITNGYEKYRGLRDAKDYVERLTDASGNLLFPPRW